MSIHVSSLLHMLALQRKHKYCRLITQLKFLFSVADKCMGHNKMLLILKIVVQSRGIFVLQKIIDPIYITHNAPAYCPVTLR